MRTLLYSLLIFKTYANKYVPLLPTDQECICSLMLYFSFRYPPYHTLTRKYGDSTYTMQLQAWGALNYIAYPCHNLKHVQHHHIKGVTVSAVTVHHSDHGWNFSRNVKRNEINEEMATANETHYKMWHICLIDYSMTVFKAYPYLISYPWYSRHGMIWQLPYQNLD